MTERYTSPTGGQKDVKPQKYHLIAWDCVEKDAELLNFGATKYGPRNWEKGYEISKSFDAMMRHAIAFFYRGENLDPESGLPHTASARFHLNQMERMIGTEFDDRPGNPYDRFEEQLLSALTEDNPLKPVVEEDWLLKLKAKIKNVEKLDPDEEDKFWYQGEDWSAEYEEYYLNPPQTAYGEYFDYWKRMKNIKHTPITWEEWDSDPQKRKMAENYNCQCRISLKPPRRG